MFSNVKYILMWAGFWKLELEEKLKLPYKIWHLYMMCLYGVMTLGVTGNILYVFQHDPARVIEAIGVATSHFTCLLKMGLCMKTKVTQLLQKAVRDDEIVSSEDPTINQKLCSSKKSVRIIGLLIVAYTYAFTSLWSIYGGVGQYRSYQMKFPNATEKPEFVLTMWFPFNVQEHFDLALFLQCLVYMQGCSGNYSSMVFFSAMMSYVVIKLEILKFYFKNFDKFPQEIHFKDPVYRNRMAVKNLKQLIKKHQIMIRFVQDLNGCMKTALLIEYSISSVTLAAIILQIVKGNQIEIFIPFATVLTFQLFLLSWKAEEIKTQSGDIASAIYECDWYNYDSKVRKLMFMIVMRARKELTLNIGPFGPNNIEAAKSRMRLAYSYLSVISGNSN